MGYQNIITTFIQLGLGVGLGLGLRLGLVLVVEFIFCALRSDMFDIFAPNCMHLHPVVKVGAFVATRWLKLPIKEE